MAGPPSRGQVGLAARCGAEVHSLAPWSVLAQNLDGLVTGRAESAQAGLGKARLGTRPGPRLSADGARIATSGGAQRHSARHDQRTANRSATSRG